MSLEFSQVPLSWLTVGTVLTSPIFEPGGDRTKLLGENIQINEQFLQRLVSRGISSVSVSKRDLAMISAGTPQGVRREVSDHSYSPVDLSTENSRAIDAEIQSSEFTSEIVPQVERELQTTEDRFCAEAVATEVQKREQQLTYVDELFVKLNKGDGTDTEGLTDVCRESIRSVVSDKDLFLCLGINPYNSDYPTRHSMHVSSVAISIGVMLGLDDASLVDLGTGCLIHDVGMLKLDQRLYKSKRTLTSKELSTVSEHPILTMDALACPGVSLTRIARIVAYQIHERCNGSGYPRGATGDDLHILSKIAAVADAYVGLVSDRSHRRGMMPYYAMEKMLHSIPQGLFDPKVVRGLLHAVSLFPIGSFVETSDQRIGRVVRATGETYLRPMIELWNETHHQFEPGVINLANESSLSITRAVPALPQRS